MSRLRFAVLLPFAFILGCSNRVPTATVELIDTSLSITPRAEKAALHALQDQIDSMNRGDVLILIPITGDAENDAGGRILRLRAPAARESYDADLRRYRDTARTQFTGWVASVGAERYRTDILGTLDSARQEIDSLPTNSNRHLVIVSDFLEDDDQYRFVSHPSLATPDRARALAVRLRSQHAFPVQGISLCLGRLESIDFPSLAPQRKRAVQAFWATYFAGQEHVPDIQIDGMGMLAGADDTCFGQAGKDARK
jgi:hypothetical protein